LVYFSISVISASEITTHIAALAPIGVVIIYSILNAVKKSKTALGITQFSVRRI